MVDVDGQALVMATHPMVAVPERALGRPVANLFQQYDEITEAVGMIFNGF